MTISNEPDNKHILNQLVMYELSGHNKLHRRAKKGFKDKIGRILSVISAYSIQINILKNGPNQKYNIFIDNFSQPALKWVGLIEKKTLIVFSRTNFDTLSGEDYF